MAEIVNLNKYRKARERAESARRSAENRIIHGRTGPEKASDARVESLGQKKLDGERLDSKDDSSEPV